MAIKEMELAVCEKLPELIDCSIPAQPCWLTELIGVKFSDRPIHWPTEGLQVCHEAEKLLDKTALDLYNGTLRLIVFGPYGESPKDYSYPAQACIWNATYEQRLEALCRVWFPKRFQASPTAEAK